MGRIILFIGALFVLCFFFLFYHSKDASSSVQKSPVSWHLYTADQGKFQIEFPALPQVNSEHVPLEKGESSLIYHIYTVGHPGGVQYMVSVIEHPPGEEMGETDAIFQQMMDKMVAADPLQRLYKMEFGSFQGYRTLDFSIRGDGHGVEVRLIRVGQTIYLLSSSYPTQSETIHSEDFQHFLKSFKLS